MKILIILNHFNYFIYFPFNNSDHEYYYLSGRKRYLSSKTNTVYFIDENNCKLKNNEKPKGDWENNYKMFLMLSHQKNWRQIRSAAYHVESFLEKFIEKNNIKLVITGGSTGIERCTLEVARTMNVPRLCIWEGYFRPNTISFDTKGMNAESDFYSKLKDFKKLPSQESYNIIDEYITIIKKEKCIKSLRDIHSGKFNILCQIRNRWTDRNDFERIRIPYYDHLISRMAYYYFQYQTFEDINDPFILFPLQTHTDSNVILNGLLFPFDKYLYLVCEAFNAAQKELGCKLVIKEHPFDVFRKTYRKEKIKNIIWVSPELPISALLSNKNCLGVVVVNSTVGLESLLLNKPVLVLANAIYALENLVSITKNLTIDDVANNLIKLKSEKVNMNTVKMFSAYLYHETQVQGNLECVPTYKDIINFEKIYPKLYL